MKPLMRKTSLVGCTELLFLVQVSRWTVGKAACGRIHQQRIAAKLDALLSDPYPPDAKKLKNGNGRFRIRVDDYRIIYRLEEKKLVILIIKVGHRRNIYD